METKHKVGRLRGCEIVAEIYFNQYGYYGEAYIKEHYSNVIWYPQLSECEKLVESHFADTDCVVIRDTEIAQFLEMYVPITLIPVTFELLANHLSPGSNFTQSDELLPVISSHKRETFLSLYVYGKLLEQNIVLNPSYFYVNSPIFYFGSVKTPYELVEQCKYLSNVHYFLNELLYEIVSQKPGEYTKVAEWFGNPKEAMPAMSEDLRQKLLEWGLIMEVQKGRFEVCR